jgi:maltooligosyltrehalose trehalohydrolase
MALVATITKQARQAAGGRSVIIVVENERQQGHLLRGPEACGYGVDAVWNDDFHHSAVVAITGRREAYYSDHRGAPQEFISAAKYGYLFQGQRYAWQKKARGTRADDVSPAAFVNFIENHDQLANSGDGSRTHAHASPGRYRAMTALLLLLPGTPMLFQGEEFGASSPFLYFADHEGDLASAVHRARAEFVRQFPSLASPDAQALVPVPHDPRHSAVVPWNERDLHAAHLRLHQDLLALRREDAAFSRQEPGAVDGAVLGNEAFVLRYEGAEAADERLLLVNLGPDLEAGSFPEPLLAPPDGHQWQVRWSSDHPLYGGIGVPPIVTPGGWRIPGHAAAVLAPAVKTDARHRTR